MARLLEINKNKANSTEQEKSAKSEKVAAGSGIGGGISLLSKMPQLLGSQAIASIDAAKNVVEDKQASDMRVVMDQVTASN